MCDFARRVDCYAPNMFTFLIDMNSLLAYPPTSVPLRRRQAALSIAICLTAVPALAQDAPAAGFGRADCRIAAVAPPPLGAVDWVGACKDGHAEGPGELAWRGKDGKTYRLKGTMAAGVVQGDAVLELPGSRYAGTFKDGAPHGRGVFVDADGARYEGDVRDGARTGTGIGVTALGDRYEGEWLNGVREGQGHAIYALGGEYAGQWHAGKRHGHGVLTYAGSGRRVEGEFADGHIVGTEPAPMAGRNYDVTKDKASGIGMPRAIARGSEVPTDVGYARLKLEQRQLVNSYFPALEEGDEPPYPAYGPLEFYELMSSLTGSLQLRGDVMIYANVGADGKVAGVDLLGLDTPDLRRRVTAGLTGMRFKPAVCRGQPCAMRYPFRLHLGPRG
jgi:hypothetical protein